MTSIVEAVHTVLNARAELTDLVSDRIYSMLMPQDSPLPTVTTEKISSVEENVMAGSGGRGTENARIRVASWAESLSGAQAAADEALIAMKGSATFEAIPVFEQDFFERDPRIYRVVTDYSVWYKNA